jgi:ribosomal protein S27AE
VRHLQEVEHGLRADPLDAVVPFFTSIPEFCPDSNAPSARTVRESHLLHFNVCDDACLRVAHFERKARQCPRDGAIIFADLIGKLDVLRVACDKCGRNYFPLDGDLTAGPLLLPGFPGILETS